MIESRKIPTLVIGTVLDVMTKVPPPRAVFVDHPVGRTFGRPCERQQNEELLLKAVAELAHFSEPGQIRDLHCQWDPDGSRAWEDELRQELLSTREGKSN